uniref:RNase H type-1 domain-containing protein n=1 Tax=Fagus sylvatica TaxID=28930 RepID=A0A2N9GG66_FAGSY
MQPCPALHSKEATTFQIKGLLTHHVSANPMESGRPRVITRRHKMPLSLQISATSVGAVCGKRISPFTAPLRKDCMVRTRSMEINAQLLPFSSQSPEMAAMEKQVRDLTANLQELGWQNQALNQKLLQRETERERKRTKGRVRRDVMLSLDKSNNKSNNKSSVKNKKTRQEAMKVQLGEMKDEFKGRATRNLDTLVHRIDSPFIEAIISFPLPSKFRMPSLENFDGTKDPLDHLESFKTMMCLQRVPDEIMCRAFPTTLKGPIRIWFKKLTPGSVGSFAQLSHSFFNHFISGQRYGRPTTHLLNVKRKEGETFRSYLTRFNKETLLVDGADDKVVLTAFISGLQLGDFLFLVYKDPPTSMLEMMYEAQRYMNGEEALQARDSALGKKRKNEYEDRHHEPLESKPKTQRNRGRRQEDRSRRGSNKRDDPTLKWPGKLMTNPDRKAKDKYCHFHKDHGHSTENCYDLKRQIEELIKQGELQRFVKKDQRDGHLPPARPQRPPAEECPRPPVGEIHMITGGMAAGGTSRSLRKAYARQTHNEDSRKVVHPHDDTLVVSLEIAGYSIRRVLIDNGSSADIIYLTAFQQMRIGKDQLRPIETPLVGFTGTSVYPPGVIFLQIIAGTYPRQATKRVEFLVADCPSAYNVIIKCPTLNRLRAVTLTYHLLVRFPIENEVGEMKGDQAMARECYLTSVTQIEGDEKKTTRIGTTVPEKIRDSIVQFLRENADVFAWSHEDMPGISTNVMVHKLNVNPSIHPVKQKRRVFAPERNTVVMEEVDKLLTAGFIREVYYPEWPANVVMVKKSNGKWQMCVDFTDLNKTCPKDRYPLPRIDQLVDSTAGHKLATYQRLVNKTFHDQIGRNVEVYMDDMLVKSMENEAHLTDLKETFQALRAYNMKLNPEKCTFGVSSGKFLGFMVSQRGIEANSDKIKAILEMSPPKTVKEAFQWTEECQRAFEELKEERVQKPVYYTSRALKRVEERYSNMEKLAFALLIASRKLRPYFQAHSIIVLTDYPFRKAMNKPDATGRLIQWSIEMKEDELEQDKVWTVSIDGSSTMDVGGAGITLVSPEKDKFEYAIQLRFRATNNKAEYEVLLAGLKLSKNMGIKNLTVKSDSQLVIGQVKGEYEAREDRMKKYLTVVQTLLPHFKKVKFIQIPREENADANQLARLASSGEEIDGFLEVQGRPSTKEEMVNSIRDNVSWMSPIIRYFKEGKLPTDKTEARKLRIRASHFQLLGDTFYKMGFSRPHLRCLLPEEANYVIREVHEGICGNHSGARALFHKLTKAGYYWPSLLHDTTQYVKTCNKCQHFTNVPRIPPEKLTPITSPWPFAQWGLNIMGPFAAGTKQAKHPQANDQVEVTNQTLLKQIKTRLEGAKSMWVEELPSVLWAYRTIVRTPTKETPFKLTFSTEAVVPVKIGLTTLRTTFYKEEENEGQLRLNLDLLDETREKVA